MIVPYKNSKIGKKEQVEDMFDTIAGKYDFLNHFLSLGVDKIWRKKVCKIVSKISHHKILDMASGTGDLAIAMAKLNPQIIKGMDISRKMLEIGEMKVEKKSLSHIITFQQGNAEDTKEPADYYDVVTCAFGVRNFENMPKGIQEIKRILKPKGHFIVLELSMPRNVLLKSFYYMYFRGVLPILGKIISRDSAAYTYLPESVKKFPKAEKFIEILEQEGFRNCSYEILNFGISTIFIGEK